MVETVLPLSRRYVTVYLFIVLFLGTINNVTEYYIGILAQI